MYAQDISVLNMEMQPKELQTDRASNTVLWTELSTY